MTYEIAGVALVDMGVWHWMYDHPTATPAQLKDATLQICKDVWNKYYAPVFGKKDVVYTLGIYSHMINSFLYLPDYPLGHLIAFQIERQIEKAGQPRLRVRAHGEAGQHRAGHLDEGGDGRAGRPEGAAGRDGGGAGKDQVTGGAPRSAAPSPSS